MCILETKNIYRIKLVRILCFKQATPKIVNPRPACGNLTSCLIISEDTLGLILFYGRYIRTHKIKIRVSGTKNKP